MRACVCQQLGRRKSTVTRGKFEAAPFFTILAGTCGGATFECQKEEKIAEKIYELIIDLRDVQ